MQVIPRGVFSKTIPSDYNVMQNLSKLDITEPFR